MNRAIEIVTILSLPVVEFGFRTLFNQPSPSIVALYTIAALVLIVANLYDAPITRTPYVFSLPLAIAVGRLTGFGAASDVVVFFVSLLLWKEQGFMAAFKSLGLWFISCYTGGFVVLFLLN